MSMVWRRWLAGLLGMLGIVLAPALAAPRIGVVTMQPGEVFWERFGHNAIVVDPSDGTEPTSYNFGYFDPDEPDFLARFIRGEMRYRLVPLRLTDDLRQYRESGRGVQVQWLNLQADEANRLALALALNARPENARYDYRYFTDNCSTRVRDALDLALEGALKTQLVASSTGNTYRSEAVRLAWPAAWMALGFDLGLSGHADRALSRWEDSFIPMRLADALREAHGSDGQPLVAAEESLAAHRLSMPPEELPDRTGLTFLLGIALAIGILALGRRHPRVLSALALPFWAASGLLGLVMAGLWLGTGHTFAHGNQNLWLFPPLCLLLLPGAWRSLRGLPPGRVFQLVQVALVTGVLVVAFLQILPGVRQQHAHWVLLLGPVHWALARHFRTHGSSA